MATVQPTAMAMQGCAVHSLSKSVPLHIGIVTETYSPEINGVALTLSSLAHSLCTLGHRVTVVRPRCKAAHDSADVEVIAVPGAPLPRYPDLRFGLPVTRRLKSLWRRQRPDALYIATEGPLGWAAARVARELGIPAVSGYHTRFDDYARYYRLAFAQGWIGRYLRRFHNHTLATLVPTEAMRADLHRAGFNNCTVLPRGVDTHLFSPTRRDPALRRAWGVEDDTPVVLTVGRIAPEKNLDLAVRAYSAFQAEVPDARYVWVGDGPTRARFQRQHPGFIFTGTLRGDDLARHYASADVFLFPSQTETYGNVTLEALASGLALVAFDYGAAHEHVSSGSDGYLAPLDNAPRFIAWAAHLGRYPDARHRLRRNARQAVAKLSPERVAHDFTRLLRRHMAQVAA